jgi:Uma2 family endonuclease
VVDLRHRSALDAGEPVRGSSMTGHAASERMTVAAFLDWAAGRPEGERWELVDGEPVPVRGPALAHAMAAETVVHARVKRRIDHALGAALAQGGHACEVFVSGPKVQIDAGSAFEPDVVVSCAEVPDGLLVPEPLIVVEVLSPSARDKDLTVKLAGYAALPSVAHYLLVDTRRRLVVHHHRAPGEQELRTRVARSGTLRLDPPGLDLDLDAIYAGSGV